MTNGFVVLCPDIFIIKKLFYNIVQTWCLKMRDVIISPSLTLLLKVWVWYRCQNRIEKYPPWWKKLNKKDIPEKWDPGPIHDTRDSQPSTQDRTPRTISGSGTWNFKVGTGTWDPSTRSRDPRTYMWDPIQETNTWDQSTKTHFVDQSTVFCVVLILIYSLEFSSQFFIIAKWFQINTC